LLLLLLLLLHRGNNDDVAGVQMHRVPSCPMEHSGFAGLVSAWRCGTGCGRRK
jgi:hypothetical protein